MKKKLLSIFALSIFSLTFAQVGIGTKTPDASAVLDINSKITNAAGVTRNGGLLLPIVTLEGPTDVVTILNPAVGLMVYNDGGHPDFLTKGFCTWDGVEWKTVNVSTSISPSITGLECENASLSPSNYKKDQSYNGVLTVPYSGGNGGAYSGALSDSNSNNGLTYKLLGGYLVNGAGAITYSVKGKPMNEDPTKFSIQFLGKGPCEAVVGSGISIRTILYSEKTVELNDETTLKSETKMGDLRIRYNTASATSVGHIEFSTIIPTHVTWVYHKSGKDMSNIEAYGQEAVSDGNWFRFMGDPNKKGITSVDPYKSYDKSNNNKVVLMTPDNTANLNPTNRDLGYATLTLHSTNEVYRVTLNASGEIAVTTVGGTTIPAKKASVTIFIEQLTATPTP